MKKLTLSRGVCWIILLALFIPIHFFALDSVPSGLHVDEVSMGYDAWCLVNYGVDRNLDSFPVYLKNYGGGQSALYAYLCAALIKLTGGVNTILLRIPIALFSLLTMVFGALIVDRWIGKKHPRAWFVYGLFYLIAPFFVMNGRFGLDCNLMLGASTMFLYVLIRAVDSQKTGWFFLSGLAAGLVLYTYAISYLVMILFLALMLACLIVLKKVRPRHVAALCVPLLLLAWPLIAVQIINLFDLPQVTIGGMTLTKLPRYRSSELALSNIRSNVKRLILSVLVHDGLSNHTSPRFWTLYPISVPFAIAGGVVWLMRSIRSMKKRAFDPCLPVLLWLVSMAAVGLLLGDHGPSSYRVNGIFFAVAGCVITGIYYLLDLLRGKWKQAAAAVLALVYAVWGGAFLKWYFCDSNATYAYTELTAEAIEMLAEDERFRDRTIYCACDYTYYLYTTKTSPYDYNLPERDLAEPYGNYLFVSSFDEPYDPEAIYVINERWERYCQGLLDAGFQLTRVGDLLIYAS